MKRNLFLIFVICMLINFINLSKVKLEETENCPYCGGKNKKNKTKVTNKPKTNKPKTNKPPRKPIE